MRMWNLSKWKDFSDIIQALATVLAISVGGVWTYREFVQKREPYQRAELSHEIKCFHLVDGKLLLNLKVAITNRGNILLTLLSGEVRLQQILPLLPESLDRISEWKNSDRLPTEKDQQIDWPPLGKRTVIWPKGSSEIEPGQQDEVSYDFIIDDGVKIIEVSSFLPNVQKPQGKETKGIGLENLGWHLTTIHDLQCSREHQDQSGQVSTPENQTFVAREEKHE